MWLKLRSSAVLSKTDRLVTAGNTASPPAPPSTKLARSSNLQQSAATAINVNDEYEKALRTKSYIDVWTRIRRRLPRRGSTPRSSRPAANAYSGSQDHQDDDDDDDLTAASTCTTPLIAAAASTASPAPSAAAASPFLSYSRLAEYLLEPCGEVASLLGAAVPDPALHGLFLDYFDSTLQACAICGSLLGSLDELRSERRKIRRFLGGAAASGGAVDVVGLAAYVELENPFSSPATAQFRRVHDVYDSLIRRLVLARDKVLRKARLARVAKRASAVALVAVAAALSAAFLVVGGHAVAVLAVAGGPALVGPFTAWWVRWKGRRRGSCRREGLARLGLQLDAAARGAYIMSRDLETLSRMVARLRDEVEHGKDVIRLFLRCGERWVLQELAQRCGGGGGGGGGEADGFSEQLDELEEHVYWCLLTINRIRGLVARELTHASAPESGTTTSSGPSMHAR